MDYNLPQLPGIDWQKAHRYIPEKTVLITVLKEFVGSAEKETALLEEYKEKIIQHPDPENFASYRIQAHSMKASLRSLGSDLFDEAFALETAGKEENIDPLLSGSDSFCKDYLLLAEQFKAITGECAGRQDFDENVFFDLVEKIDEAMKSFDISTLQESFESLQSMDYPEAFQKQIRLLEPAVRDLDSDTVAECCENMQKLRTICS